MPTSAPPHAAPVASSQCEWRSYAYVRDLLLTLDGAPIVDMIPYTRGEDLIILQPHDDQEDADGDPPETISNLAPKVVHHLPYSALFTPTQEFNADLLRDLREINHRTETNAAGRYLFDALAIAIDPTMSDAYRRRMDQVNDEGKFDGEKIMWLMTRVLEIAPRLRAAMEASR